jgi:hypothetical protein
MMAMEKPCLQTFSAKSAFKVLPEKSGIFYFLRKLIFSFVWHGDDISYKASESYKRRTEQLNSLKYQGSAERRALAKVGR